MRVIHGKWDHRWLSPKTEGRVSKIFGVGVFAKKNISQGEVVAVLGGVIVPKSEIRKYRDFMGNVGIQIDRDFFIVPSNQKEIARSGVFNHSCNPNIGFSTSISLVAIRNIESGEELVFDYAFNETFFEPFTCNCGSKSCRKTIRPDDWKKKKIRKQYGRYYSPYLRDRI